MQITNFDQILRPYLAGTEFDWETWEQIYLAYLSSIGIKLVQWEEWMEFYYCSFPAI
jgi:hypothetical protein